MSRNLDRHNYPSLDKYPIVLSMLTCVLLAKLVKRLPQKPGPIKRQRFETELGVKYNERYNLECKINI